MAHERLYLYIVLAGSLFAGVKAREWRTGIVEKTAYARQDEGGGGNVAIAESNSGGNSNPAPSVAGMAAAAAAMRISRTWHGFRITGNGYAFIVACPVGWRRQPNVTSNGPIRYALEKGKFYLLDDDGREFKMAVIQKELLTPPAGAK
jgi:hypothetical protein